jgi:hypothetical protein
VVPALPNDSRDAVQRDKIHGDDRFSDTGEAHEHRNRGDTIARIAAPAAASPDLTTDLDDDASLSSRARAPESGLARGLHLSVAPQMSDRQVVDR